VDNNIPFNYMLIDVGCPFKSGQVHPNFLPRIMFFLSEKSGRKRTLVSLSWSHVVNSILCLYLLGTYIQSQILINRQISNEALELFYSTYPFHFPQ